MQISLLIFAVVSALAFAGCTGKRHSIKHIPPGNETALSNANSIEAQRREIFRRIVREIPAGGRLGDVRGRGTLRVALPPENKPFQYLHEELNAPAGFNVALARQMAEAIEVKPEIDILSNKRIAALMRGRGKDYDIVFRTPGMLPCNTDRSIRYFFIEKNRGWLTICVTGPDDSLKRAVENILSYFKESGIYTYIYTEYFNEN